jgi:hypothetical protein
MEQSSTASDLLWDEQQSAIRARTRLEHLELLKNFVLVFALIVLTLTAATVLAGLGGSGTTAL